MAKNKKVEIQVQGINPRLIDQARAFVRAKQLPDHLYSDATCVREWLRYNKWVESGTGEFELNMEQPTAESVKLDDGSTKVVITAERSTEEEPFSPPSHEMSVNGE